MKKLTISQKIGGGFAGLIAISAVLGGVATWTMRSVSEKARQMSDEFVAEAKIGERLNDAVAVTQLAARSYGFTADEKLVEEIQKGLAAIDREKATAGKLADEHPQLVKLRSHLTELDQAIKDFKAAVTETEAQNRTITAARERLNAASTEFMANLDTLTKAQDERLDRELKDAIGAEKLIERHRKLTLVTEIRTAGNLARIAVFKAQALRTPAIITEGLAHVDVVDKQFSQLKSLLKVPADIKETETAQQAAVAYRSAMLEVMSSLLALAEISQKRAAAGDRMDRLATEISSAGMERTVTAAGQTTDQLAKATFTVQVMMGVSVALGLLGAFFLSRAITRVLRATTDSLTAGAEQIAAAANQVSGSSQHLAEGASEQAASLEETSATMEEMSGMTKRTAQSANNAKEIAQAARRAADQSATAVSKLNGSMVELKASSSEVAKIVKTIDEIAFQTNILALNAAVEAARAGEAGAGFAVVAEEVRSLAHRCALAAKETAQKIEDALHKTDDGSRISTEVSVSLGGIIELVRKLDGHIVEIATASSEQAQGIEQVNTAVSQMDKLTQSNAAAAEESASAAEEMSAQTAELNGLVGDLLELVGGHRSEGSAEKAPTSDHHLHRPHGHHTTPRPATKPGKPHEPVDAPDGHSTDEAPTMGTTPTSPSTGFFK